jgi:hypothetical protein
MERMPVEALSQATAATDAILDAAEQALCLIIREAIEELDATSPWRLTRRRRIRAKLEVYEGLRQSIALWQHQLRQLADCAERSLELA